MSLLKKGFQFPLLKIEKKSPVINTGLFLFEDHRMIPESSSLFQSFLLASLNLRPKSKFQEKVSINIRCYLDSKRMSYPRDYCWYTGSCRHLYPRLIRNSVAWH